jgi:hypothetical protein
VSLAIDELFHLSKEIRICVQFERCICEYRLMNTAVQSCVHSTVRKVMFFIVTLRYAYHCLTAIVENIYVTNI